MKKKIAQRKKKKLGSYPSISVVVSMTLALMVTGLFGTLLIYSKNISKTIQENMQIQVFLDRDLSESQNIQIEKTLADKPFVLRKDNQVLMNYISKEEAAEEFIENTGENFYEFIGENPLHDSYVVNINADYQTEEKFASIAKEIEAISGVFEVDYVPNMLSSISNNINRISLFLIGFAFLLIIAVILLINNTIKLALFSQRFLIRSMQLVGAKSSFIQQPFLVRSTLQGMGSGILASIALMGLINYGKEKITGLDLLTDHNQLLLLFGVLIILGAFVGLSGTYMAINKYLKMSLDELY